MTKLFKYVFSAVMLAWPAVPAPSPRVNSAVATITVSANLLGDVDVIVMKNLDFEIGNLSVVQVRVNPQSDTSAGQMKIVGLPNSLVRVTYEGESILHHEGGESPVQFRYNFSGGPSVLQRQSIPLAQNNQIRLNDQGAYYLWVGGILSNAENLVYGNYFTELTIELEYIL